MTFFAFLSFLLTTMFLYTSPPLMSALIISTQSLIVAMLIFYPSTTAWYSFILLMIFLSGMMIIFTYVSSLAPNEIMTYQPSAVLILFCLSGLAVTLLITMNPAEVMSENTNNLSTMLAPLANQPLLKLYSPHSAPITILLITYLLLTLIVVVKTTSLTSGPLRASH